MKTRTVEMDPRLLRLLEVNARYMRHEVFMRLVENVKRDGVLTQIPFAARPGYFAEGDPVERDGEGQVVYEVLSGNHRVKAAIKAGLQMIDVQLTDDPLTPDQRRAIQLSHNEIVGEDDPATLKVIYDSIEGVEWRVYSGLDDKKLELLEKVEVGALTEANLQFQPVTMLFLPDELEQVAVIWDEAKKATSGSKAIWLAQFAEYDRALDAIEAASRSYGIKNTATALMIVLEVFSRHLEDLSDGWLDHLGEPMQGASRIPLSTVLGTDLVPASVGALLSKAINRMMSQKELDKAEKWRILERWAGEYLGK